MATYLSLINLTQQGVAEIKRSPSRLDQVKRSFEAAGAKLKAFYLAMGRYDMVLVAEAPDDETVAKLILSVASVGSVRTETFRIFDEDEYRNIIDALP
jgi:uncharacterized protein with GYD domain